MMKKNEKKPKKNNEELVLNIEISDTSSEMIVRLEKIIQNDIETHKLPNEFKSIENKGDLE